MLLSKISFPLTCQRLMLLLSIGSMGLRASQSMAAILPPTGGTATPAGTFSLAGETHLPAFDATTNFNQVVGHGLSFDFSLSTQVYSNPSTGGLDFVYQLTNTGPNTDSSDTFERLTVSSFSNFTTDVDYQANTGLIGQTSPNPPIAGDVPASEVDRSGNGSVIGYELSQPLTPTSETDLLIVRTNATQVAPGSASVIDGFQGSVVTEVPFGAMGGVPEPASIGLISISLFILTGRRRAGGR